MTLAIISDLHLGPFRGRGPFSHGGAWACRALESLIDCHDKVVVAGDLFDLDLSPRLWDKAEGLALAEEAWSDVLEALAHPKVERIHGNHDRYLGRQGVPEVLKFEAGAHRLGVIHGHQLRPLWRLREGIKAPVKWGANQLLRTGLRSVGEGIIALNDRKEQVEFGLGKMGRGPVRYLKSRGDLDLLVSGHTHRPGVWKTPHGLLGNSGSWAFGRKDVLTVDLEAGVVTLGEVDSRDTLRSVRLISPHP